MFQVRKGELLTGTLKHLLTSSIGEAMFKKGKESIGLDIGSGSIKAVELKKNKGSIELTKANLIELSLAPDANRADRKKEIKEALEKVLKGMGVTKGKTVSIATHGQSVYIRYVKLPPVDAARVKQIVSYEAQQQIPIPLEEVIWDHQILKSKEAAEINVVLVAMKSESIRELLEEIATFRIEPDIVDYGPLASYNCLKFNQELSEEETSILIDMGAKSTDLSIEREGNLCWTRSVPLGGNDFTQAIQRSFELSFAEAEKLKKEKGIVALSSEEEKKISQAIIPVLSRLVRDVERSLTFFRAEWKGATVNRILLTGGGAKLTNLDKFLERELGIEVKEASPLKNIGSSNGFPFSGQETSFAVAIGLALRPLTKCASEVSLLPLDIARKKEFQKKKGAFILSFILALLIAVMAYAFTVQDYRLRKEQLEKIKVQLAKYQEYERPIKMLRAERGAIVGQLEALRNLTGGKTFWLEMLLELSRIVPDEVTLTNFSQEGGILTLGGESPTMDGIIYFVSELDSSPFFGKVNAGNPERADGKEFYQFSFEIPLEYFPFPRKGSGTRRRKG